MRILAVGFDFWETLYTNDVPLGGLRRDILASYLAGTGYSSYDGTDTADAATRAVRAAEDERRRAWATECRILDAREWTACALRSLRRSVPEDELRALAGRIADAALTPATHPFPGVRECLRELSAHRKLGIVSNTGIADGARLRRLLVRDGLDRFFRAMVFSDETGRAKPDPGAFLPLLAGLGIAAGELVHVGDSRDTDVAGARALGIGTVRFAGGHDDPDERQPEADRVIGHFGDLPDTIRSMES